MEDEELQIWRNAKERGICLIHWAPGPNGTYMAAAIADEVLAAALDKFNLEDTWTNIYSLGLGFFVEFSAPGNGKTIAQAYNDALTTYETLLAEEPTVKLLERLK